MNNAQWKTFDEWFYSAHRRRKYDRVHPAYLAAEEAWQASRQAPVNVPEGWKLVPIESTSDMDIAGMNSLHSSYEGYIIDRDAAEVIWNAMVGAAPTPATTPEAEWVKPSEDLPSENGRNPVWYWDNHQGVMLIPEHEAHRRLLRSEAHNPHWMPTGLKRPTPPQEQ